MGGLGPVACFFRVRGAREKISVNSGKWKFGKYVLKTSHNKEHYF